jgi:preprotein translocase subunit Sec61beta
MGGKPIGDKVLKYPASALAKSNLFKSLWLFSCIMSKNDKVQMPSSGAGITRYFDDYKSKVELKPSHVIILAVIVILVVVILHWQGGTWFK